MKRHIAFLIVISFLAVSGYVFAAEITADSRINEITVYPDSALITRVANLKLSSGENKVIFQNIIPEVDENSLRVSSQGDAQVRLFGAELKKEFLEEVPSVRIKELKEQIQKLEDEKRKLEDNSRVLSEEREFLDSVRLFSQGQIPKDLVTKMPPAKDLDDTLKFLSARLKENYNGVIETELGMRDLQKKIDALRNELGQISGSSRKLKRSI